MARAGAGRYWFPAKRYGWGWGLPRTWEGWLVLAAFVALIVASAWLFPPRAVPGSYFTCVLVLAALLFVVCWLTGEPPRWRWGDDRRV
jgi:hypothetical protein